MILEMEYLFLKEGCKMKLVVKPKDISNLNEIKADAFIFGMKEFCINNTSVVDIDNLSGLKFELKNKEIFLSIDKNIFDDDLEKLEQLLVEIDKLNISGILFYDICLLTLKDKLKLKTPLIWNQNFFVTNYKTLDFYKKYKISGAVISTEITIDEIEEIAKRNKDISLFINGFGYQLMSFSKRKLISNYFKYIKQDMSEKEHYLQNKDGKYKIIEEDNGTAILSSYIYNVIKEVNSLKKMGIDYLILDEKELNHAEFLSILDIFDEANINNLTEEKLNELDEKINKIVKTSTGFLYKKTIYKVK